MTRPPWGRRRLSWPWDGDWAGRKTSTWPGNWSAGFPARRWPGPGRFADLGWLEYRYQVGQTGATVNPKLYIALGISGARQHTMGMQGSGFIVAVSTDPQAAIFNIADVCIVENLADFIPVWLDRAGPSIDRNL